MAIFLSRFSSNLAKGTEEVWGKDDWSDIITENRLPPIYVTLMDMPQTHFAKEVPYACVLDFQGNFLFEYQLFSQYIWDPVESY